MSSVAAGPTYRLHAFHVGCWVLGLIAFGELVAVGVAMGLEQRRDPAPTIVEYVSVPTHVSPGTPRVPAPSPAIPSVEVDPSPVYVPPSVVPKEPVVLQPLNTPAIADPIVERLVREAQASRVGDDMRGAIVKLEEAAQRVPDEPNVLYQFAQVFEAMGVYGKAEDYYYKVYALGASEGGSLYVEAADKLNRGFLMAEQMRGKLALGRVWHFFDKQAEGGQRVILTIPVIAAPNQVVDLELLDVKVTFYDELGDKVIPAAKENQMEEKWVGSPIDWRGLSGEEKRQVTYFVPEGDVQDRHLNVQRKYFGQVVELSYKGELVDSKAWPRTLAQKVNVPNQEPLFLPDDFVSPDFNPENPLLPPRDHNPVPPLPR